MNPSGDFERTLFFQLQAEHQSLKVSTYPLTPKGKSTLNPPLPERRVGTVGTERPGGTNGNKPFDSPIPHEEARHRPAARDVGGSLTGSSFGANYE